MKKLSKLFDKTFLKFIAVGIANTIFGTAVMFVAYNIFSLNYWVSSALNYILGSILSYFLNKNFTFKSDTKDLKTVLKFIVNITVCYLLAYGAAKPLVTLILSGTAKKVRENLAMLAGMGIFVILNYFGQRFGVFNNKNNTDTVK